VLLGCALLAGCGAGPVDPALAPSTTPDASSGATAPSAAAAPSLESPAPDEPEPEAAPPAHHDEHQAAGQQGRCRTDQVAVRLGTVTQLASGQAVIPLVYTNTSPHTCQLRGVPDVRLQGPPDPNGPVYTLRSQDRGGQVTLAPRKSAASRIVVLSYQEGSVGSFGSTRWVPARLDTTPPGQPTPPAQPAGAGKPGQPKALTVLWPAGLSVLRQDAATHPGSWVESFTPLK
jgi:hypothetical protein